MAIKPQLVALEKYFRKLESGCLIKTEVPTLRLVGEANPCWVAIIARKMS